MDKRLIVKQILQKFSNRNNILSSTKIIDYANRIYGITISRNTITKYINDFIDNSDLYNVNIQKVNNQGFYVEQNPEQEALLQMLDELFHEKLNDYYVKDGLLEKLYEQLGCSKNIINNTFKNDSSLESNKQLSTKKDIFIEINKAKNEKKFVELTLKDGLIETVFPCGYFGRSENQDGHYRCIYFNGDNFEIKKYFPNKISNVKTIKKDCIYTKAKCVLLSEYIKYYKDNFVPEIKKYNAKGDYRNYLGFMPSSSLYHKDSFNHNSLNNLLSIETITIDNNDLLYYSKNSADKDAKKFLEIMEFECEEEALMRFIKLLIKNISDIDFIDLFDNISYVYSANLFDLLIVSIFKILINSDTWIHDKSNYEIIIRKCLDTLNEINICNKLIIFDWSKFYYLKDDILISNNIYDSLIKLIMSDNNISFNDVIDNENEFLNLINKAKVLNDQSMINFIESILIKFLSH